MKEDLQFTHIVKVLKSGGIAVVRTDTVYGLVARASDEDAVARVYAVKKRNPMKQCIILLSDANDAPSHIDMLRQYSQEAAMPTSVIVPASTEAPWLLCGGDSIAYRVVRETFLKKVIAETGPLIAPSANPEGLEPARTIQTAQTYFGDSVDCYIDGGTVESNINPSALIEIRGNTVVRSLR